VNLKNNIEPWIAAKKIRIPDFIICGAMKCGTTTIHQILNNHPYIFIPNREVNFFDIDNLIEHPDFLFFNNKKWFIQNIEDDPQRYWQWYSSFFSDAKDNQLIGEDSPIYIASEKAAIRIASQTKPIKIIIILRNPTHRSYSHYWHLVRTGRATHSFEDTIRYEPNSILLRSNYKKQIENFLKHIPKSRIIFVLFEDFLANKETQLQEICNFLNVDYDLLPKTALELHANKTLIPKYINLHLLKNRIFREQGNSLYLKHLPNVPPYSIEKKQTFSVKIIEKIYNHLNYKINNIPKISESTKLFLDKYFQDNLIGLNELIQKDAFSVWFE
jgi:hypothetical protein